jgi:hypothetical protein
MRRRARTDLCGGRSAMVVPTATAICSGSNFLSPLFNGKWRPVRKAAPNIGDSREFTASPAAATRRAGRLESRSQRTERPKVSVWAFGYTRYLTERRRALCENVLVTGTL